MCCSFIPYFNYLFKIAVSLTYSPHSLSIFYSLLFWMISNNELHNTNSALAYVDVKQKPKADNYICICTPYHLNYIKIHGTGIMNKNSRQKQRHFWGKQIFRVLFRHDSSIIRKYFFFWLVKFSQSTQHIVLTLNFLQSSLTLLVTSAWLCKSIGESGIDLSLSSLLKG